MVISNELLDIDRELFRLAKDFELLSFINPTNIESEKTRFFKSGFKNEPNFHYRIPDLDPRGFQRKLHRLQVENIKDNEVQKLYADTVQAFSDRIDIICSVNSNKFLDNNLRYFGEPKKRERENAEFILYCPSNGSTNELKIDYIKAKKIFEELITEYGFNCEVRISKKIVSKALVKNQEKVVLLKEGAKFSEKTLKGTAQHEIGVHMLTTMNSNLQPLKIFNLGLPLFTKTQEGLAIMSEYLSGNTDLFRLKELAMRVMAIRSKIEGNSFAKTFSLIHEEYKLPIDDAFYLVTRVYRGGGCTKDYLYMTGFSEVLNFYRQGNKLDNLLIGKVNLKYLPVIESLIKKKLATKPKYITQAFRKPKSCGPIIDFLVKGIK